MEVELLCLANSQKLGGRCLAGLRTDGQGWIRPVTNTPSGTLSIRQASIAGAEIALLDVVRADLASARPEPHQPENHILASTPLIFVENLAPTEALPLLSAAIERGPDLLRGATDRIARQSFDARPTQHSLSLIEPAILRWVVTTSLRGNPQVRGVFSLSGTTYDLVVTDLVWKARFGGRDVGTYPPDATGTNRSNRVLLVISLSEPLNGMCYKLIAGVIVI
ncbi:MAG: hypothetical protein IIC94_00915 [Chloroflexi bacterium]|nr:hypothetical protein [Chloroflexota bacterium]